MLTIQTPAKFARGPGRTGPPSPETVRGGLRSLRHYELKAKLLRPFGQGSDLLLAISAFVVFGPFVDVLLSMFDEPVKEAG